MSPWWLRPTADEEEAPEEVPRWKHRRPPRARHDNQSGDREKEAHGSSGRPGLPPNRRIALFCDVEDIALSARKAGLEDFDIGAVVERLLAEGKIVIKRAYADWRHLEDLEPSWREAGLELVNVSQGRGSKSDGAAITMAVDAMELCYTQDQLDTFAVLSGNLNISPLVSKLKKRKKHLIGGGLRGTSARSFIRGFDEFIFYEDVGAQKELPRQPEEPSLDPTAAMAMLAAAIESMTGEGREVVWGTKLKQTLQRRHPSFSEADYGYSSFSELLEDAQRQRLITLKRHEPSGTFIVSGLYRR